MRNAKERGQNGMEKELLVRASLTVEETEKAGEELAPLLEKGDFIALEGELGAGKTAFVRGICRKFCPQARVCSPTYTVMRCYEGGICPFYHFDMYRIASPEDLESVGFYDCEGVIAAEWSENTPYALPKRYYRVNIEKTAGGRRIAVFLHDGG